MPEWLMQVQNGVGLVRRARRFLAQRINAKKIFAFNGQAPIRKHIFLIP